MPKVLDLQMIQTDCLCQDKNKEEGSFALSVDATICVFKEYSKKSKQTFFNSQ